MSEVTKLLNEALTEAKTCDEEYFDINFDPQHRQYIKYIVESACMAKNIGVYTVLITLIVKKIISPSQDIRLHQSGMNGGFSGRTLDTKEITPFLRDNDFPYMKSGSGWLTRSLEHATPYNSAYTGRITPKYIKEAFLFLVDVVESMKINLYDCLVYIFCLLIAWRERDSKLVLARPHSEKLTNIVTLVSNHWKSSPTSNSRLPVLAVYAIYQCLVFEVERYKKLELLDLLPHTSSDIKTNRIGDIELTIKGIGVTVEAVEIKHDIPITIDIVKSVVEKAKTSTVRRFYILSTKDKQTSKTSQEISDIVDRAVAGYGCLIIINGVEMTLEYYLRLISKPEEFLNNYVSLLEQDSTVSYEAKQHWNMLVEKYV